MRLTLTCLLLALTLPASAAIYKYTDATGNTVYTNQPPEGIPTETVELPPTNSVKIQAPAVPASGIDPGVTSASYGQLQLGDLPTEEALRANNGTFGVSVNIAPALRPGHQLRLLLDGQPYGQASNGTRLQLNNIDRGEHSLAVEVLSGGQSIQQSAAVTFTVQRVDTRSPALRPPSPPPPKPTPRLAP
ncbi:MAG TPA: DUF4124 domain-containing protein [Pseudomonas sp.]|nr:DUF4124 domain-containing protein [Pseudomonas sp.]